MAAVEAPKKPEATAVPPTESSGTTLQDGITLEGILSEDYLKNPLLQPTNKTADEIVAEIMAKVSDEGVLSSLKRMGELHEELEMKIKNYQTSFDEQMAGIQADIQKYWEIDKEYEKYHTKLDELCADDGQKPASQQIKEMMEAFKEGKYKEGLEMVTAGDPFIDGLSNKDRVPTGLSKEKKSATDQANGFSNPTSPDVSVEDVFSDASSETSESSQKAASDPSRVKSPKGKKTSEDAKGKKVPKKKTVKT